MAETGITGHLSESLPAIKEKVFNSLEAGYS